MAKRSNVLVALGVAFFALGAAIVFLLLRDDTQSVSTGAVGSSSQVLVATTDIAAGTSGEDLVAQGMIEAKTFEAGQIAPGAITSTAALANQAVAGDIAKGAQLTASSLRASQARRTAVVIPEGKQAVAVQLGSVPAMGGYVSAGDRVNMYSVVRNGVEDPGNPGNSPCSPRVHLFLSNVEVLDVIAGTAPAEEPGGGGSVTYVLALDPFEAERVIFLSSHEGLHIALPSDQAPPVATPFPGMCSPVVDQVVV